MIHRRIRKSIRDRTGESKTNRKIEQVGDLLAILSNLWNENYQKLILGDVEDLSFSLTSFVKDLFSLRKEYRKVRKETQVLITDDPRINILEDLLTSLESI